jgi:hypothetical protein
MKLLKLLYRPFGIIAGQIAARVGKKTFQALWARIDDAPAPASTTEGASVGKVVGARALEAATMAGVAAAVDRAFLRLFQHLTGLWAGPKPPPPEDEK